MKINIGNYPGLKSKKDRVIKIKIEKWDTWSMDHTLALIIEPMLIQLKKTTHGAPNTDDEDVPENLRSTSAPAKENEYDVDANHFKRWDWILDEMIWAFHQMNDDDSEDQFYSGKSDIYFQAVDKDSKPIGKPEKLGSKKKKSKKKKDDAALYQMVRGPKDTFKIDKEGLDKHWARIKNALRLFGRYYSGLWD